MVAALAGFYQQVPVGHIEAGLRTGSRYSPFPEEMNRHLISQLATYHFCPTETAVHALRQEGVGEDSIFLTGNTVIDALHWVTIATASFGPGVSAAVQDMLTAKKAASEALGDIY